MKRFLQYAGVIYASFALVAAHSALAPNQTAFAISPDQAAVVAVADGVVRDSQRLDVSDSKAGDSYFDEIDKDDFTIVCWTGDFCSGCKVWKRNQAPALLKLGYTVMYKDYFKDDPPKSVQELPTIQVKCRGKVIEAKIAWEAKDIDKFVMNHLKGG